MKKFKLAIFAFVLVLLGLSMAVSGLGQHGSPTASSGVRPISVPTVEPTPHPGAPLETAGPATHPSGSPAHHRPAEEPSGETAEDSGWLDWFNDLFGF